MRSSSRLLPTLLGSVGALVLAACSGSAVVTLTATPSIDTYLSYRVGLTSIDMQTSNGETSTQVLATPTTVDLTRLLDVSEVLSVAGAVKGNFSKTLVTLDYSAAKIVYDDGSISGVALRPVDSSGATLGKVQVSVALDPSADVTVGSNKTSRLAMDFKLGASNLVNLAAKTVTVRPMIVASAAALDNKTVRIRGPISAVDSSNSTFTSGIVPFDFPVVGSGSLPISATSASTFEINGVPYTGAAGLAQLSSAGSNATDVAYGTLTSTTSTTNTTSSSGTTSTSTSTTVAFAATQVFAGSSAVGGGSDCMIGTVSARSGNTLTVEDATLVAADGSNTYVAGTSLVSLGANTAVTEWGQGAAGIDSIQNISVGSRIYAFGTVTLPSSGSITLDASVGRVQLAPTQAQGLVTSQESGALSITLTSLAGRASAVFDFTGTGTSSSVDASTAAYTLATGSLDLTYAIAGAPVAVTGLVTMFGAAPADFSATSLLDSTTLVAQLVLDWGAGTVAPFSSFDTSEIDINVKNASIGSRHVIQIGSQSVNIAGLASDPLITPGDSAYLSYAIGHAASGSIECFNSYSAFMTALQSELNGSTLALGMTASGEYTTSTYAFVATNVTLYLNN